MWPIETYADIYDQTYRRGYVTERSERARFGHLIIRDSNTAGRDYLLVGCNKRADNNLDSSIRLHKGQVKQVIRALHKWLVRIGDEEGAGE